MFGFDDDVVVVYVVHVSGEGEEDVVLYVVVFEVRLGLPVVVVRNVVD